MVGMDKRYLACVQCTIQLPFNASPPVFVEQTEPRLPNKQNFLLPPKISAILKVQFVTKSYELTFVRLVVQGS